jgi:hypothetical protein
MSDSLFDRMMGLLVDPYYRKFADVVLVSSDNRVLLAHQVCRTL